MKINNISVSNYRFFKDVQKFNFGNNNILLYGENGSGKTSLSNAIQDFFFYYKNETKSKLKLLKNQNIFCQNIEKPTIEIVFEDETKVKFTETGLDNEILKEKIEEVSKSKLFLTYQDIYILNNIFKKNISYNEFKEIFTILYFDELDEKFNLFEYFSNEYNEKLTVSSNEELLSIYNALLKYIKNFDFDEIVNIIQPKFKELEDAEISSTIISEAYYLSSEKINLLKNMDEKIKLFIDLCDKLKVPVESDFWLKDEIEAIIEKTKTLSEDLESLSSFTIENKIEFEGFTSIDELINVIDSNTEIIDAFLKMKSISSEINDIVYGKLSHSKSLINRILSYLEINLEISDIVEKNYMLCNLLETKIYSVDFKIELSGKELKEHWSNLNEAKLSALNISIYLSSVLGKKPDIPILLLDDLLISLDMSNRDRILNLLLDRNGIYFDDEYQLLILTHDRTFYELAKHKIEYQDKENWDFLELYVDKEETLEKPYLKKHIGIHQKAKDYFDNRDYAVASNYLRKEVEKQINDFLGLKTLDGAITTAKIKDNYLKLQDCLPPLITVLKNFANCSSIPAHLKEEKCVLFAEKVLDAVVSVQDIVGENSFHDLDGIKDRILNPQSHNDITMPLYKKELEDAFKIVKELDELIHNSAE